MRAKVFKNEKVKVLENEINAWLNENPNIEVVDTAVAANQFIVLYNPKKERYRSLEGKTNKIKREDFDHGFIEENSQEVQGQGAADLTEYKFDSIPEIKVTKLGERAEGKGIIAPHISDYYKDGK